jgi:hypothetical protein
MGPRIAADCGRRERPYNAGMDERFVSVAQGSMAYIKELVAKCEQAGIAASLDRCRKKS